MPERTAASPGGGLARLRAHLADHRAQIAVVAGAATVQAAAQTGSWLLVGSAIDEGIVPRDSAALSRLVALYLVVSLVGWSVSALLIARSARIGQDVVLGLRRQLFDHLTRLSPRYFSQQRGGWIIARLTSDVDAVSDALSEQLPKLLGSAVLLPAATIALFVNDWRLATVALVVVPPAVVLTRWYHRRSSVAQLLVRDRIAAVTAQLSESVASMAIIQAYRIEEPRRRSFDRLNDEQLRAGVHAEQLFAVFFPALELLGVLASLAVVLAGIVLFPGTEIGALTAAYFLVQMLFQPLQNLSDVYARVQAAAAAMIRVGDVLDVVPEVADGRSAAPRRRPARAAVGLHGVVFGYGHDPVLHGIDLSIPEGASVAVVGPSGSGKSTLVKLMVRFYDPWQGAVRVDGVDVRELSLRDHRRQLGVVLQEPFLFTGTIADNLRFAQPGATRAQLLRTAGEIGLEPVLSRMPGGLDHRVREGGVGLSAGERQLIAIGRALLADPRILVFDEATSNVDRPAELLIERALERLLSGRTSIVVAHRLATVRRADEIVVLSDGRIAERGSERELLAHDGPYRELAFGRAVSDARRRVPERGAAERSRAR